MKIRRMTIWMIVFSVLAVCAIVYTAKPWESMGDGFDRLMSGDMIKSDEVVLVSGMDTLVFSRTDSTWLDDAGALVSKEMVENVIFAAERLQKKSIVGEEEISGCDYGVKIVFRKKGKLVSDFMYASGNLGDFVYAEGDERAYGVEIPGYETLSLRKVFSSNRDHYHLHMLIDLLPSEIAEVEVWPLSGGSFRISQDEQFNISVFDGERELEVGEALDEHKLRMLLTYFNSITYSEQVGEAVLKSESAIAKVKVKDLRGQEMVLEIYSYFPELGDDADIYKAAVRYNGKSEVLLVDYYYLDLLIRGLGSYE